MQPIKKVTIVYHYLAHYRLPIFQELMKDSEIEYTILSGVDSEIDIKKVDTSIAGNPVDKGGLRWFFLKNRWLLKKRFLWQSGLLQRIMKGDSQVYIFLGSPYHISTWFGVMLARLKGKKVYYWMHGIYSDSISMMDYVKIFAFYRGANGFFLYGHRAEDKLKKYFSNKAIHVIYNSLDYASALQLRRHITSKEIMGFRSLFFANKNLPIVVFIGRLNSVKRIDYLIEAQAILRDKHKRPFFNICVIGDGEERAGLEKLSEEKGTRENIFFAGAVYDEQKNSEYIQYADLCVTPGEVGLTAIHALSYGTPVISHNNLNIQMPEVEAIRIGETGSLFEYNSIEDLATVIETWLTKYPVKSEVIIRNCYNVIDNNYNPEIQAKIFNNVLRSA
ncbi:MAG TPA: glycosyltransferase [Chitinophagaceae bacterium]|nr:glycosyltransferase [Chitinophagaceae bacterium]